MGSDAIVDVFSAVHYELFAPGEDCSGERVPTKVWMEAVKRSTSTRLAAGFPAQWDGALFVPSSKNIVQRSKSMLRQVWEVHPECWCERN